MKRAGRFITLEGGDGAGKSTQLKRLVAALKKSGVDAIATREPGGSPGAEQIRDLVVNGAPGRWDVMTETLLMFAARADHVARTIKPALARGQWVICDRFTDSTYAYQGAGGGLDRETIRRMATLVLGDFAPDLTLVLDLDAAAGLERTGPRNAKESRFEKKGADFHQRLRQAFLDIARRDSRRCVVVDAAQEIDAVQDAIWNAVAERYKV